MTVRTPGGKHKPGNACAAPKSMGGEANARRPEKPDTRMSHFS
jgi:hypothetical protein